MNGVCRSFFLKFVRYVCLSLFIVSVIYFVRYVVLCVRDFVCYIMSSFVRYACYVFI